MNISGAARANPNAGTLTRSAAGLIYYAQHEIRRLDIGDSCRRVHLGGVCHFNSVANGGRSPRAPPAPARRRQGDSNRDANPDGDFYAYGDSHRDANSDGDFRANPVSHRDANRDGDLHPYRVSHSDPDLNGDNYANADGDFHPYPDSNGDAYANADGDLHTYPDSSGDFHPYPNSNGDFYTYPDSNSD